MKNLAAISFEHDLACRRVAARFRERWLRIYARKKLRSDPVFPAAFALLGESREPLIDLGCGVGLLPFYLRERNFRAPIIAIDSDRRKIRRAREVAGESYREIEFVEGNVREPFAQTGNITLFDLLHYLRPNEQRELLERLARRVAPGGMLIVRDCPREKNWRFWLTDFAERFAQLITWSVKAPLNFSSREEICAPFLPEAFTSIVQPLWGRTPLNNHLFVFRRRADAQLLRRGENAPISSAR